MSVVLLSSGGLDSTLAAVLAVEQGLEVYPLFVDYGQLAAERELNACSNNFAALGLPEPKVVNVEGFAELYPSGLTDKDMYVYEDAFLPGRNMLFLLLGATYACNVSANSISMGLLSEELSIFPDQTQSFLCKAQDIICEMTGRKLQILAPLMNFTKKDVLALSHKKGITGTYSCHAGEKTPCGSCIACKEFL